MFCNCRSLMHLNLIMELREAVVQHLAQHCMYFKARCIAPQQKRAPNMKEDEIISKHHFWGSSSEAAIAVVARSVQLEQPPPNPFRTQGTFSYTQIFSNLHFIPFPSQKCHNVSITPFPALPIIPPPTSCMK